MPRGVYDRDKKKSAKAKEPAAAKKPRKFGNRWTKAKELAAAAASGPQQVPTPSPSNIDYGLINYLQTLVGCRTVSTSNSVLTAKLDAEISDLIDEFRVSRKKAAVVPSVRVEKPAKATAVASPAEQAPAPVPFNPAQANGGTA